MIVPRNTIEATFENLIKKDLDKKLKPVIFDSLDKLFKAMPHTHDLKVVSTDLMVRIKKICVTQPEGDYRISKKVTNLPCTFTIFKRNDQIKIIFHSPFPTRFNEGTFKIIKPSVTCEIFGHKELKIEQKDSVLKRLKTSKEEYGQILKNSKEVIQVYNKTFEKFDKEYRKHISAPIESIVYKSTKNDVERIEFYEVLLWGTLAEIKLVKPWNIEEEGSIEFNELIRLFEEAAKGLDCLHQEHFLHCDFKRNNVFVQKTTQFVSVLSDFDKIKLEGIFNKDLKKGSKLLDWCADKIYLYTADTYGFLRALGGSVFEQYPSEKDKKFDYVADTKENIKKSLEQLPSTFVEKILAFDKSLEFKSNGVGFFEKFVGRIIEEEKLTELDVEIARKLGRELEVKGQIWSLIETQISYCKELFEKIEKIMTDATNEADKMLEDGRVKNRAERADAFRKIIYAEVKKVSRVMTAQDLIKEMGRLQQLCDSCVKGSSGLNLFIFDNPSL